MGVKAASKVQKATGTDKLLVEGRVGAPELARIAKLVKRTPCTQLGLTRATLATADDFAQLLALFPKLADLEIAAGTIADYTPLAKVKTLRTLFLNGPAIGKTLPPPIGQLDKLVDLSLLHLPKLERIDLSGCKKLVRFSLYSCKKLRDLSSLHALPALRELALVDTSHELKDLKRLVALPQVKYISAELGSVRKNQEFEALLAAHGKSQYAP